MKEHPIIMSTESVKAILDGRKTQTRRVIKFKPEPNHIEEFKQTWQGLCPYGQVGDRLFITQGSSASKSVPFEERFWSRIIKFENHWEWMGKVNRKKYGTIRRDGKEWSTHRLMWTMEHGSIPPNLHILHKCDMPWCINPEHLYLGSNHQNVMDKVSRGRVPKSRGVDNGQSILSSNQVEEIRSLYWEQWVYQCEIAKQFNISQSEVSRIVNSKRWLAESEYPEQPSGHRTLEITGIRVEMVKDISVGDCWKEGVVGFGMTPIVWFSNLWDKINAKRGYGWEANPWVWVIEFKGIKGGDV